MSDPTPLPACLSEIGDCPVPGGFYSFLRDGKPNPSISGIFLFSDIKGIGRVEKRIVCCDIPTERQGGETTIYVFNAYMGAKGAITICRRSTSTIEATEIAKQAAEALQAAFIQEWAKALGGGEKSMPFLIQECLREGASRE